MSNKPDVYRDGNIWVYRASALGGCIRDSVAARLGVPASPPPRALQEAFEEGHRQEELIVAYLESLGGKVTNSQKPVSLDVGGGCVVRGHIDGLMNGRIIEAKGFGDALWEKYTRGGLEGLGSLGRRYAWQASVYMWALDLPLNFVVRNKMTGEVKVEELDFPPVAFDLVKARVAKIEECAKAEEYPECDGKCNWFESRYWAIHDEEEIESRDELQGMLARYSDQKQKVDMSKEVLERLRKQIVETIGSGKVRSGPFEASVAKVAQKRPDVKKLRKELGEEYEENYTYEVFSVRLTVKDVRRHGAESSSR